MVKTILQMLVSSRNKYYYLILIIPVIILNILIYQNVLNFTILLLVNYIATFSSLIISLEILIQEEGTNIFSYLKTLKGENYVMMYRTTSIFIVSSILTVITSVSVNLVYAKDIYAVQQLIYLALILLADFFYIYFLQYIFTNISNTMFRNTVITGVTSIAMLSLMTRSMATYMMFVTITGLFLAVTFMNRRLTEELKREANDKQN